MKRNFILLLFLFAVFVANSQTVLIQETFQDWNPQDTAISYTLTKKLFDGKTNGTFTSNALVVDVKKPIGVGGTAEGNGNPSKGRVIIKDKTSYLQFPELKSVGKINIKASSGKDLKEFKLQVLKDGYFVDIPGTVTPCMKTVTKLFTYDFTYSKPTTIRIVPNSGGKIFIWDLEVFSYSTKP
ncbi:MAG: hypothetical protein AB9846_17315 [Tenuifilaceae bacterium]